MSKPFKGWDKDDGRWRKMIKGERFSITPEELGLPKSKWNEADSTPAARKWWARIVAEKNLESPALNQGLIDELELRISTARSLGMTEEVEFLAKRLQWVKADKREYGPQEIFLVLNKLAVPFESKPDLSGVPTFENDLWNDRKSRVQPVEEARTADHFRKIFLKFHLGNAKIKGKTVGRYANLKTGVKRFLDWFGENRDIADITNDVCKSYFELCESKIVTGGKGNSADTISGHWQVFKQFVSETSIEAKIPYPDILRLKKYSIPKVRNEPNPWTLEEIRVVVDNATDQLKAYLMLMLNCGYYQGDICDLLASQVDWKLGRINRARSKARNAMKGNSPIKINWRLWDVTFDLLKSQGRKSGNVFLGEDGKPLKVELLKDENLSGSRQDKISRMFGDYIKKLIEQEKLPAEFSKDMMDLRKTGANFLEHSEDHDKAVDIYLNHESLAARNYIKSGQIKPAFDNAVKWYGEQLGFETNR